MVHSNPIGNISAQRGFALVVTLSLMILLTVIAIGLLSLSSISLRSSSQGDAMAAARTNARMALMMAIGELQKELGPDSRISAPHDAGTSPPPGGQPHWTAVYDAWSVPTPGTAETPQSRSLKFRGWLASGADQASGVTADKVTLVGAKSLGGTAGPDDLVSVPTIGLVNKNSKEDMSKDRFFIYRKPVMETQSVMLSFIAEPDTAPATYRIDAMIDAMVSTSNPNDIPVVWPAGVLLRMEMEGFPYRPKWNIRRANNSVKHSHTVQAINYPYFRSAISGGFTLEPGVAAVFGASTTDTSSESVNLKRGYLPRGGLRIADKRWSTDNAYDPAVDGLRATGLLPTGIIDFSMIPAATSNGASPSDWISCYAKLKNSSGGTDLFMSTQRLAGGGGSVLTTAPITVEENGMYRMMVSSLDASGKLVPCYDRYVSRNPNSRSMLFLLPDKTIALKVLSLPLFGDFE